MLHQPLSDKSHSDEPPARRRWTLVAVCAIAAIYLAGINQHWRIGSDSGLYLNLADSIAGGIGYTLAGQPHTFVPPGFPAMLAGLMALGLGSFPAMNIVMAMLGLLTVFMAYLTLRELVARDYALMLTVVFALSYEMFQRSGEILSDVPFTLMLLTALWFYLRGLRRERPDRRLWEIASLLMVTGLWFRLAALPLILGAGLGLAISTPRSKRAYLNLGLIVLGASASMAFFVWHYKTHHDPAAASYGAAVTRLTAGDLVYQWTVKPLAHLWFALGQLSRLLVVQRLPQTLAAILFFAPIVIGMAGRFRRGERLTVLAVLLYVAGLCAVSEKPRTRYFLPISPLLLLYLLEGYAWGLGKALRRELTNRRTILGAFRFPEKPRNRASPAEGPYGQAGWATYENRFSCGTAAPGCVFPKTEMHPTILRVSMSALLAVMLLLNLPLVGRDIYERRSGDFWLSQQKGAWRDSVAAANYIRGLNVNGYILADQPVAYLAGVQSPMVSIGMLQSQPTFQQIDDLLRRWNIRCVAVSYDESWPFTQVLERRMEALGRPVRTFGKVGVYQVAQ